MVVLVLLLRPLLHIVLVVVVLAVLRLHLLLLFFLFICKVHIVDSNVLNCDVLIYHSDSSSLMMIIIIIFVSRSASCWLLTWMILGGVCRGCRSFVPSAPVVIAVGRRLRLLCVIDVVVVVVGTSIESWSRGCFLLDYRLLP